MRIAALYDVHSNLPALEAVLADVASSRVDLVVVGGDVIPGPMPAECVERLLRLDVPTRFIRGNGERESLAELAGGASGAVPARFREVLRWSAAELSAEQRRALGSWPQTLILERPAGAVLFCHATPRSDSEIFTARTPDARLAAMLADVTAPLVVCGHTHMQLDRVVGTTRIVNAGSVGMPFGEPGAYWLLIDDDVELRRTAYDLVAAAERIRATAYPQAEEFASRHVLEPPSETQMLDAFREPPDP